MRMKLEIGRILFSILPRNFGQEPCNNCLKIYGDGWIKCFTHDIKFIKNQNYRTKELQVKNTWEQESHIGIFFHQPGQLLRNAIHPVLELRRSFSKLGNWINFNIQSVTVLRKRKDGITGCNTEISDEDKILYEKRVKQFNCTVIYPGQL